MLVVDNVPLRAAAWRELQAARRKLDLATRDLHRHEETDEPGFRAWLGTEFAALVSEVRELALQVQSKGHLVDAVQMESLFSGRPPGSIWRAWQRGENEAAKRSATNDGDWEAKDTREAGSDPFRDPDDGHWDDEDEGFAGILDEAFVGFCADEGFDPDAPDMQEFAEFARGMTGFGFPRIGEDPRESEGVEVFRRLVQRLHPDRGGEWTPQRAQLWHRVQEAWENRDADMLARLEAEWEIAADTLGPHSDVGRLRAALDEIHAARRDAERKVRAYRKDPAWRFSLKPPDRRRAEQIRRSLEEHRAVMREGLAEIESTIAEWERPPRKRKARKKRRKAASPAPPQEPAQAEFVFG